MRRNRREMRDNHLERMSEPEPYRSLRLQKERIEHERAEAARRFLYDQEAEQLRGEIKRMGHAPCA